MEPPPDSDREQRTEIEYLAERTHWLVRVRWFATVFAAAAVFAGWLTGFIQAPLQLILIGVALALCNVFWWWRLQRLEPDISIERRRSLIFRQLVVDMAALALLLQFAGGMENPFGMTFALPAVGAMLLPTGQAVALGALGALFQGTVVMGQFFGVLQHHGLHEAMGYQRVGIVAPLYQSAKFVAGYLVAFVSMLGGVTYLVRSVTDRYRRAERMRLVHERVALSREKLARVGELSAGVAHAVRNPLHGLLNSVDLLQAKAAGDARTEETLTLMRDALDRIESVTQRLLSLTREAPLHPVSCDVDALVLATVKLSSPRGRHSLATVHTDLAAPGKAKLDANRFTEALANVLDNAIHACRDGGLVTVRTRLDDGRIAVDVVDSGEGIPAEDLSKVFDPFFTAKAVGEGTGLGLAIAQRIVEEHGGALTLQSKRGAGTTVRILLPPESVAASDATR